MSSFVSQVANPDEECGPVTPPSPAPAAIPRGLACNQTSHCKLHSPKHHGLSYYKKSLLLPALPIMWTHIKADDRRH